MNGIQLRAVSHFIEQSFYFSPNEIPHKNRPGTIHQQQSHYHIKLTSILRQEGLKNGPKNPPAKSTEKTNKGKENGKENKTRV